MHTVHSLLIKYSVTITNLLSQAFTDLKCSSNNKVDDAALSQLVGGLNKVRAKSSEIRINKLRGSNCSSTLYTALDGGLIG